MLFSKANLMAASVASKKGFDRALHGVRFEPDGSTVGSNGKMLMVIAPADPTRVTFPDTAGEQMEPGDQGLVMPVDVVEKILKNLAKEGAQRLSLYHVAMTRVPDPARVGFTCVDAKGDPTTVAALPKNDIYPDWKAIVNNIRGDGEGLRVCLNRSDMIELLKALEKACPDRGEANPVFLEFSREGRGVIARCINYDTGQHVIGALNAYKLKDGQWLEYSLWEKGLFKLVKKILKKIPPKRRKHG